MTYLLAGGDSFTDANFHVHGNPQYDVSFPKWPAILAEKLKIPTVVNTAQMGGSNELIFEKIFDNIVNKKPQVIALLLTSWDRTTPYGTPVNPFEVAELLLRHQEDPNDPYINSLLDIGNKEWLLSRYVLQHHIDVKEIVNSNLRMIHTLQETCKELSIKLLVAQAFDPIRYSATSNLHKLGIDVHDYNIKYRPAFARGVLDSPYFDKIDWNEITIGGPFFEEIGGQFMNDIIYKQADPQVKSLLWIPNDGHPSKEGHEAIAQVFYDKYKEVSV